MLYHFEADDRVERAESCEIVLITGHATIETSIQALRLGAGWLPLLELRQRRLDVEVTVVREPLEARDDNGWVLRTPSRSERVALELVRQEGRWLLWSWAELG